MMSCPVSRYLRAHCDRHALSYLSRLAPGLETHLSKHTSASFATTCGWIKLGSGSAERRWVPGFGKSKSQRRPGEIEGGEGRHTSLNIALRFSSSRNVAICGSMPCWGAISNCNPGDMRSEWRLEEGRCQKLRMVRSALQRKSQRMSVAKHMYLMTVCPYKKDSYKNVRPTLGGYFSAACRATRAALSLSVAHSPSHDDE